MKLSIRKEAESSECTRAEGSHKYFPKEAACLCVTDIKGPAAPEQPDASTELLETHKPAFHGVKSRKQTVWVRDTTFY